MRSQDRITKLPDKRTTGAQAYRWSCSLVVLWSSSLLVLWSFCPILAAPTTKPAASATKAPLRPGTTNAAAEVAISQAVFSNPANPKEGKGDGERLGIVGFCWGGRQVWLYAAHNPALKAGVAFYGRLIGDRTANTPRHPTDVVAALKAPVMGLYGGADPGIPMGTITDMQSALKKAGQPSIVRIYPAAGHAFFADYRPSYRKEDAIDAWNELKDWFKRQKLAP